MKLKRKVIKIAIDSTAGSGATSLAIRLAKFYNLRFLDTGKVYRWIALKLFEKKPKNKIKFVRQSIKKLKLKDLKSKKLVDDKLAQITSKVSSNVSLRKLILSYQKEIAYRIPKNYNGSILNGRDITYNIMPDADFKFFITASLNIRAKRRYKELKKLKRKVFLADIKKSLKIRDLSDKNRTKKQGRLKKTKDSRLINTTHLSINGGFLKLKKIIDRKMI